MAPQTRKEISLIGWIRLIDLPGYSKGTKETHPGIKLYMVTPFMAGLRKWIQQNRHKKGKLIPLEEDATEELVQEDPVQNTTADDLIAMLRRQQGQSEPEIDLLGMLRNGNVTTQQPYQTSVHQTQSYPQNTQFYPFQEPNNAPQSTDLLQFSPKALPSTEAKPEPISVRQTSTQPQFPPTPGGPSDFARRNSLLSVLKEGPSSTNAASKPASSSLFETLEDSPSELTDTPGHKRGDSDDLTRSTHQRNLLSLLKSPQFGSNSTAVSASQSPPIAPSSESQSPPVSSSSPTLYPSTLLPSVKGPPVLPTKSTHITSHQSALLSTLKSSTVSNTLSVPGLSETSDTQASQTKPIIGSAKSAEPVNYENALLSALRSPKVPPANRTTEHQVSLLATLKSPPAQHIVPLSLSTTSLNSKKATTSTDAVQPSASRTESLLLGTSKSPPLTQAMPSPVQHTSLFSTLISPTLAASATSPVTEQQQSVPLNTSHQPPVQKDHKESLLSMLRIQKPEPPVEKKEDELLWPKDIHDIKNPRMESFLRTLKSPISSPGREKTASEATRIADVEPANGEVASDTSNPLVSTVKIGSPNGAIALTEPIVNVTTSSSHMDSLLSALKGVPPNSVQQVQPVNMTHGQVLSIDATGAVKWSTTPEPLSRSSPVPSTEGVPSSDIGQSPSPTKSLVDAPKGTKSSLSPTTVPPKSPPVPTSHQKSLLSRLNPLKANASPPPARSARKESQSRPSQKGQQFDFSPHSQVGKRIKFREVLIPGGIKQVIDEPTTEIKSNGTIDLKVVTVLKRPERGTTSAPSNTTIQGDTRVLKQPDTTEKNPVEEKSESPLGIEFPFRKRTPFKSPGISPTPTTIPTRASTQSLLALLKNGDKSTIAGDDAHVENNLEHLDTKYAEGKSMMNEIKQESREEEGHFRVDRQGNVGTKREMKMLAMLEKALARIPS